MRMQSPSLVVSPGRSWFGNAIRLRNKPVRSLALLALIADLPEPKMREALNRLVDAGLVFVHGTPPEASYLFKPEL